MSPCLSLSKFCLWIDSKCLCYGFSNGLKDGRATVDDDAMQDAHVRDAESRQRLMLMAFVLDKRMERWLWDWFECCANKIGFQPDLVQKFTAGIFWIDDGWDQFPSSDFVLPAWPTKRPQNSVAKREADSCQKVPNTNCGHRSWKICHSLIGEWVPVLGVEAFAFAQMSC